MPNGISCAYFAAKNYLIGKHDDNIFRTGIAGAQAARTVNCMSKAVPIIDNKSLFGKTCSTMAKIARKIVYPLIICSGAFTTIKSKDKVRTGVSQGCAISSMYVCEKLANDSLTCLDNKIIKNPVFKNNKPARFLYYILKGSLFAAASIFGYNTGNNLGKGVVDYIRNPSGKKAIQEYNKEDIINTHNIKDKVFEEIEQGKLK